MGRTRIALSPRPGRVDDAGPRPTPEEDARLARQAGAGDLAARNALAARHHGLVFALARSLARRLPPGMEPADLVQEGFLALYRAAQAFDPDLGHRFSTYATWLIWGQMSRALHRWRHPLSVSLALGDSWARVMTAHERAARAGREPTAAELAAAASCRLSTARAFLAAASPPLRLDDPWDDAEAAAARELPCPRAPNEAALVARLEVEQAVARLPRRWQTYIRLRFGLDGGDPLTQAEAARAVGCHRVTAQRWEQAALARLEQLLEPPRRRPHAEKDLSPPASRETQRKAAERAEPLRPCSPQGERKEKNP
jgi:RNA polymerase sigma factor (sigma-70 family)